MFGEAKYVLKYFPMDMNVSRVLCFKSHLLSDTVSRGEDVLVVDERGAAELAAVHHEGGDPRPLAHVGVLAVCHPESYKSEYRVV